MAPDFKKLNRFTTIPFLIDMLRRKKLALVNPSFWEDFNDRETVEVYRKAIKAESIYALCLSFKNETVHHWNAFANGSSGCSIEFSPTKLLALLDANNIKHGKAEYVRVRDLGELKFTKEQLPFVKREPFTTESEYRIIATSGNKQEATMDIDFDLNIIRRITISNKMPESVYKSLKAMLLEMVKGYRCKISRSTLYKNEAWIKHFSDEGNIG
jgi:hypothetical protein